MSDSPELIAPRWTDHGAPVSAASARPRNAAGRAEQTVASLIFP
jgi:hypothetical protein